MTYGNNFMTLMRKGGGSKISKKFYDACMAEREGVQKSKIWEKLYDVI